MKRLFIVGLALQLVCALPAPLAMAAQAPANATTAPSLQTRAAELPDIITGKRNDADYFTPEFLAAVPSAQLSAISASLIAQYGQPIAVERVEAADAARGIVHLRFEKAVGRFQLVIDPAQGGRVAGLLVTGFTSADDSFAVIAAEVAALPGATSLLVERLDAGDGATGHLLAHNADQPLAIGSTFKLYILAEMAARARQRKLRWDDVTTLDRRSFSSAGTGNWPPGAPVTLHSLAAWMISVSDNAATDILLDVLGRDAVGARMAAIGNSAQARTLPFLNTVEAFALKSSANDELRARYLAAPEAEQRRILDTAADRLMLDVIDSQMFVGKPLHIDTIEWFASARDLARLMDHLRLSGADEARAIMAINPGIARDTAAQWAYAGYKGGSEAGVISMSFLLQAKTGRWYAVSGSWNNVAAPVDNGKFSALMQRLVDAVARADAGGS